MKQNAPIQIVLPRAKRRCLELYAANSPFRAKVVQSKRKYQRHMRMQKKVDTD